MAIKASAVITLIRVDDGTGYTILLSNESYAFAAGITAALAGSTSTNVVAYKNTAKIAATVSKIGNMAVSGNATGIATGVTGLAADVSGNGTESCKITFKATTALTTKNGIITITVIVDGKTFTKDFSFSLSPKGETGGKGDKGDPTGIIESATEPTTKYNGMLWKHTGTVSGLVKGATYKWNGTTWEMFKFRAENIEAESFKGYQFDGSIFTSAFENYTGKLVTDNLYHKNEGYVELGNGNIKLSYGEYTSPDNKTWTKTCMHQDTLSSLGMIFRIFSNTGTLANEAKLDASDLSFYGFGSIVQKINELNRKKQDALTKGTYSGNINNILESCVYWCSSSSITGTLPFSDFFTLITMCPAATSAIQIAFPYNASNSAKWRMYANGKWGAWRNF